MNTTKKEVKVGLIGVGLNTYWNQFEGLLSRLTDYQRMIKERMSGLQATVIDGGGRQPGKGSPDSRSFKK